MIRKLKSYNVVQELRKRNLPIFTPLQFQRIFDVSKHATSWFIKSQTKAGIFVKLRQGLYMLADYPANDYVIANYLYAPSYISFDTALSFYGIIPEVIYNIASATTKTTREFEVENIHFMYHKIKREAYSGYTSLKYLDNTILIAEPEKALADFLYFVTLKKRSLHYERLNLKKIKKTKLISYIQLFNQPKMLNLVEKIYVEQRHFKRIY